MVVFLGHGSSAEPFDVLKAMSVVEWLAASAPWPYRKDFLGDLGALVVKGLPLFGLQTSD